MFNMSSDARVRRSMERTADSFVNLLKEKPYCKISVSDLADGASVTRKTYYRNFSSMDDLVEFVVYRAIAQGLRTSSTTSIEECVRRFFEFCYENRELFTLLYRRDLYGNLSSALLRHMRRSGPIDKTMLASGLTQAEADIFWNAMFGSEVSLLRYLIEHGFELSIDEACRIYESGFRKSLRVLSERL